MLAPTKPAISAPATEVESFKSPMFLYVFAPSLGNAFSAFKQYKASSNLLSPSFLILNTVVLPSEPELEI